MPYQCPRIGRDIVSGVFGKPGTGNTAYATKRTGFATAITSTSILSNTDWRGNRVTGHGRAFTGMFNSAGSTRIGLGRHP